MNTAGRLITVSNRLPVTVSVSADGQVVLVPSAGGLVTALSGWHKQNPSVWIGWSGAQGAAAADRGIADELTRRGLVSVGLSPLEVSGYYDHFSNGVLWPLCHYLLDRVPLAEHDWQTYRGVNQKFADAVVAQYRPGDRIWVHDYHLMLVPEMVRRRLPDARIGFFLHVPFPSSEVFRILPWRGDLLEGMLGADLIGFHTYGYVRHFAMSALHILGREPDVDRLSVGTRDVWLKALPIGIDAQQFAALGADPDVIAEADTIRREAGERHVLLGIDRLDYTKGLPRRLLALEQLLRRPAWHDRIRFIQIAVPTRDRAEEYRGFKRQVEELVTRINGTHGQVGALPLHYLHKTVSLRHMAALFLAADVMVVTPLRDGLNLVAKEFVATRTDGDGVLVLSEFAGAATELGEALIVNPYDVSGLADALAHALVMGQVERRARMRALRTRVLANTASAWAQEFLLALDAMPAPHGGSTHDSLHSRSADLVSAPRLVLVLDYDGTLVPIQPSPDLATPDGEVLDLVRRLASTEGLEVHIVSGRPRETLETWLGGLPVHLWAEHGYWHRCVYTRTWIATAELPSGWRAKVEDIIRHFTQATPGSVLEPKSASITWHYRVADPQFGATQAHELRMLLGDALSNQPLEVREGKKTLEVRLRGVNKGMVIRQLVAKLDLPATIIAVGDDDTDEDMFAALPPSMGFSVHIGEERSQAQYRLQDCQSLRAWLETVIAGRRAGREDDEAAICE
ncbi:MAG: bifunctional alpha,alpha-trehalose-phosphate synthase (UDP-forming)/trehalose-phosphatase [Vicinamibacterales bacterium]